MATKNNPGKYDCYGNAGPDEPIFTLRAKDPLAEFLVAAWAALKAGDTEAAKKLMDDAAAAHAESGKPLLPYQDEKSIEAQQCASAMRSWRWAREAEAIRNRLEGENH